MKIIAQDYSNMPVKKSINIKDSIKFKAGWNIQVSKEINNCNIKELSQRLANQGIKSDFGNNKTIAWCCEKVTDIFSYLNTNFNQNLALPKGIFVEDFSNLYIDDTELVSFCNWFPAFVKNDSKQVIPERTLFFNSKFNWSNINTISDNLYNQGYWGSDHFLGLFIHEFDHAVHNNFLLNNFNHIKLQKKVKLVSCKEHSENYRQKFGKYTSKISIKASENELETIAEDMQKNITKTLSSTDFMPITNPFVYSSYPDKNSLAFLKLMLKTNSKSQFTQNVIFRKFWNGEFFI